MKNISNFASKLNVTQVINKKGLSSIKGGASDPPPFGVIYASDPPPFGVIYQDSKRLRIEFLQTLKKTKR